MRNLIGSMLLVISNIWLTISTCATMIVGFLIWLSIWLGATHFAGIAVLRMRQKVTNAADRVDSQ